MIQINDKGTKDRERSLMLQTIRDNISELGKNPQRSTRAWVHSASGQEHKDHFPSEEAENYRQKIKGQNKWHGLRRTWDYTSGCLLRSVVLDKRANIPHIFQSFLFFCSLGNAMITIYYFGIIFSLWIQIKASSHMAGRTLHLWVLNSTCVLK